MTDKEFRQLKRSELIDIIYEYQKQEKQMQEEIRKLRAKLRSRNLKIQDAGSIAEATAGLSGIFQVAQKTADAYLEHIYAAGEETERACEQMIKEAKDEARVILETARREAERYGSTHTYERPVSDSDSGEDDDGGDEFEYIDC